MIEPLRIAIADDERPARSFLASTLRKVEEVVIVGEARNGLEAIKLIESEKPDLAFLDLQMPEVDGLGVVRLLDKNCLPLIAFVTAYDEYAVRAFELNAVDYVLKPVEPERLRKTLERAHERLKRADFRAQESERLGAATTHYESSALSRPFAERIPVRKRDEIVFVPIRKVASMVAEGELLHIRTTDNETHTITYSLRDIEARVGPNRFVRLGRGTLVNVESIRKIVPMPGGTFTVLLSNNEQFRVSRLQSRFIREHLLQI